MTGLSKRRSRTVKRKLAEPRFGRTTSKGQIVIHQITRKRYKITMQTKIEFVPSSEGILLNPTQEKGNLKALPGSASKNWTVDDARCLDELRKEKA